MLRNLSGNRMAWTWLACLACLAAIQPFFLGFYLDDWPLMGHDAAIYSPFSWDLLRAIYFVDPSRPVSTVFRWITGSLFRDLPAFWHIALVAANACIVFLTAALIRSLLSGYAVPRLAAVSLSAAWTALPWTSGVRYWPTILNLHVFLAVFLWLLLHLLRGWRSGKGPWLTPFLSYLLVCLGYEALYGQFIVAAFLGMAEVRLRAVPRRAVLRSVAALAAAQACALAWNYYARRGLGAFRSVYQEWPRLLVQNLKQMVPQMFASFGEIRWLAMAGFVVLMAGAAAVLYRRFRSTPVPAFYLEGYAFVALSLISGALVSIVVFSMGGRPLVGFGVEARGMSVLSLWALVAFVLLLSGALQSSRGGPGRVLVVGIWLSGIALLTGQISQFRDWFLAARLQAWLLARTPVAEIRKTERGAEILCVFPPDIRHAPVFAADWDLNPALRATYPALSGKHFIPFSRWAGPIRWDGSKVYFEADPAASIPATAVYLWRPLHGEFVKLGRPAVVRTDFEWQYTE